MGSQLGIGSWFRPFPRGTHQATESEGVLRGGVGLESIREIRVKWIKMN